MPLSIIVSLCLFLFFYCLLQICLNPSNQNSIEIGSFQLNEEAIYMYWYRIYSTKKLDGFKTLKHIKIMI